MSYRELATQIHDMVDTTISSNNRWHALFCLIRYAPQHKCMRMAGTHKYQIKQETNKSSLSHLIFHNVINCTLVDWCLKKILAESTNINWTICSSIFKNCNHFWLSVIRFIWNTIAQERKRYSSPSSCQDESQRWNQANLVWFRWLFDLSNDLVRATISSLDG